MPTPKIILVEPAGALNIGSVARVMKNMGLNRLVLVNPQCNFLASEARQMAVHGIEVLEQAIVVPDLPTALKGCQRAIATTARSRSLAMNLESPRIALPWLLEAEINSALIFGPEDRGLSNSELSYAQRFVEIPANPEYPSLNLAQAVAVCVYELYQALLPENLDTINSCVNLQGEEVKKFSSVSVDYASLDAMEGYYQHLETLLLEIGYLYPHTTAARMEKFRRLYYRANLSKEEVAMLRGVLSQIQWAIKSKSD